MRRVTIREWTNALELGSFRQNDRSFLRFGNLYCPIGVACQLAGIGWRKLPDNVYALRSGDEYMPDNWYLSRMGEVGVWLRKPSDERQRMHVIAELHGAGWTFKRIAQSIRLTP